MFSHQQNIIVVRIVGGLGNQMFQYACGRALAVRSGARLLLDISAFERYKLHGFGLDGFETIKERAPFRLCTGSALHAVIKKAGVGTARLLSLQGFHYISENDDLSTQSQLFGACRKAYIDGYWQCEDYFRDVADLIRSEFRLRTMAVPEPRVPRNGRTRVSLHIRRGDYVNNVQTNAIHGVLSIDYYEYAISFIEKHIGSDFELIVFSDDIEWARQNLASKQPMTFVPGSKRLPHTDLHMMAACDHHIIANSSFSWWGAWLNPSPVKTVIAPKRWFMTEKYAHHHICPPEWIRV